MLGRQAKKLIKLMYGGLHGLHGESERTVPEYAHNMRTSFEEAYKHIREKVGDKQKHQKRLYNKKIHSQPYKPGDLDIVALEKVVVGKVARMTCAHRDTKKQLWQKNFLLLGTGFPELTGLVQVTGVRISLIDHEHMMVMMTRAKAKQQLEDELIRKEKQFYLVHALIQLYQVYLCILMQLPLGNYKLKILPTLTEVRYMLENSASRKREAVAEFLRREGVIYRKWIPKGRCLAFQVEQLVLPKYGMRYPEAVPLKNTDVEHIANKFAFQELWHPMGHLSSQSGVQQGDLLGPILFALVLQKLISTIDADDECLQLLLQAWYLDDGVLESCNGA
eukprot:Em0001g3659a